MEIEIVYRNRQITIKDIAFIKDLIADNPGKSRWFISRQLCQLWDWRQSNGALKDMVCRGLLLKLEKDGLLTLPPRKRIINNPLLNRKVPEPVKVNQTVIDCDLRQIQPIRLRAVRRTKFESLYNSLIQGYHYLGYSPHVGEHIKYIAFYQDRPIGCLGWTSAPWYIGCRDKFIGWSAHIRKKNLHLIAYQTRFLILPWIKVSCLASHLLGLSTRMISRDWLNFYNHPIYFVETFVDITRFRGTCYQAANWRYLVKPLVLGSLIRRENKIGPLKQCMAILSRKISGDFYAHKRSS